MRVGGKGTVLAYKFNEKVGRHYNNTIQLLYISIIDNRLSLTKLTLVTRITSQEWGPIIATEVTVESLLTDTPEERTPPL